MEQNEPEARLPDLELIRDLRDKGGDLLHEPVHTALAARLQESGDGQRGNAAVGVSDEVLQVQVARGHSGGMLHGHLADGHREDNQIRHLLDGVFGRGINKSSSLPC